MSSFECSVPEPLRPLVTAALVPNSYQLLMGARTEPSSERSRAAAWIMGLRRSQYGQLELVAFLVEWTWSDSPSLATRHLVTSYNPVNGTCVMNYEAAETPGGPMVRALSSFATSHGLI